jgi:hypothetical protein
VGRSMSRIIEDVTLLDRLVLKPVRDVASSPSQEGGSMEEHREHGYAEGQERGPHHDDEEDDGRFSEGQEKTPDTHAKEHRGRFSEGEEELPDTPEKEAERRYSEGQEGRPPE